MVKKIRFSGLIKPYDNKLGVIANLLDILIISATLWLILGVYSIQWTNQHTLWLLSYALLFHFFSELNDLYKLNRGYKGSNEIQKICLSCFGVVSTISVISLVFPATFQLIFLIDPRENFRFWLWVFLVPVGLILCHLTLRIFILSLRKMGRNTRRVAVVGATYMGEDIKTTIIEDPSLGMIFKGYFDDRRELSNERLAIETNTLSGNIEDLICLAKDGKVDIVFITLPMQAEKRIKKVLEALSDTTASVYFVPDLLVFDLLRSQWSNFNGIPIVSIHDTPFYGVDGMVKRIFDIVMASMVLLVIAIPMIMVAICIKATSPGPVLFKQRRYGFKGEEIIVWKFRSMEVCEDGSNIAQATKNDPRLTPIGKFIRKTSIDELPQFLNVLQGRMSIVGPRPHAVAHNEQYRGQIKGYMLRHKVKPGITGLAQINGFRGETDTLEKMQGRIKYDLEYITQWSLWLDFKIFLLTFVKGFTGENAY
ncbi:MAG: undecaprenyl-phosphate glucose phosphotransferase [Gammaproteobacteria bacterium]